MTNYQTRRVEEIVGGIPHKELTLTLASPFVARCVLAQATGNVYQDGNEFWASGSTKGNLRRDSITVSATRNEDALAEAEWTFQKFQEAADQVEEQLRGGVLAVLAHDLQEMSQEVIKADDRVRDVRFSVAQVEDRVRSLGLVVDSIDRRTDAMEREAEKAAADFEKLERLIVQLECEHEGALEQIGALLARVDALERPWYRRRWQWLRGLDIGALVATGFLIIVATAVAAMAIVSLVHLMGGGL